MGREGNRCCPRKRLQPGGREMQTGERGERGRAGGCPEREQSSGLGRGAGGWTGGGGSRTGFKLLHPPRAQTPPTWLRASPLQLGHLAKPWLHPAPSAPPRSTCLGCPRSRGCPSLAARLSQSWGAGSGWQPGLALEPARLGSVPSRQCPPGLGGSGEDNGPSQPPRSPTEEPPWLPPRPLGLAAAAPGREQLPPASPATGAPAPRPPFVHAADARFTGRVFPLAGPASYSLLAAMLPVQADSPTVPPLRAPCRARGRVPAGGGLCVWAGPHGPRGYTSRSDTLRCRAGGSSRGGGPQRVPPTHRDEAWPTKGWLWAALCEFPRAGWASSPHLGGLSYPWRWGVGPGTEGEREGSYPALGAQRPVQHPPPACSIVAARGKRGFSPVGWERRPAPA